MKPIRSPHQNTDFDRFLECQEALEERVRDLIADAMHAGWGRDEAAAAITDVLDAIVLGGRADDEVEDLLRQFYSGR